MDLHVGVVWWLAWVEYGIEGCGIETCGYGIGARYVGGLACGCGLVDWVQLGWVWTRYR